jgi:ribosome-binding ATPase YchF (GTP1/OBG family)
MLIGLVGKPSVGKSTFFKAATLAEVEIASYPFTTIKPNEGVGFVKVNDPAKDFGKKSNPRDGFVVKDKRFVPVQLMDVAGLVPGAHKGEGMGNQFLDDLRQADVLIHVIDVSGKTNEKGEQTEGYDPANDIRFLEEELDHWYNGIIKKGWERFARMVQQEHQDVQQALAKQLSGLKVDLPMVEDAIKELSLPIERPAEWSEDNLFQLATYLRKRTKPMIIACNKADVNGKENFDKLVKDFPDLLLVPCSAESELALREAAKNELISYVPGEKDFTILQEDKLSEKQQKALTYIKEHVLAIFDEGSGVQAVLNDAVFNLLKYMAIYPGGVTKLEDKDGNVLPDCFLMPPKSTALDFAFRLHTDFGNKFIRAIDVKTKRTVGKEHPLKDGDIVEIVADK